jgi:hypothetical protein
VVLLRMIYIETLYSIDNNANPLNLAFLQNTLIFFCEIKNLNELLCKKLILKYIELKVKSVHFRKNLNIQDTSKYERFSILR